MLRPMRIKLQRNSECSKDDHIIDITQTERNNMCMFLGILKCKIAIEHLNNASTND